MRAVFWVFGLLNVANGLWMLLAPAHWYQHLPAAVPDTGPLNTHFVRDIGAAFTTIGVALCVAAPQAERHRGTLLAAMLFYVLHAVVHVADLASGRLHQGHWLIDLPGVFVPAIVLAVLSLPRWWAPEP
jgi:uncharacterized protein YjeT (DUF2065 family)